MRVEEAQDFSEEDEEPARVFAQFDAAEKGRTARPQRRPSKEPDLKPLRELLAKLGAELKQDVKDLRPLDRLAVLLRHLADMLGQRSRV